MSRQAWAALALATIGCVEPEVAPIGAPNQEPLVRPDTPGNNLQFRFDRADVVESYASSDGRFRVHFTRDGDNAVPAEDEDASGVPDFVEEVASVYVEVLDFYESTLGFRAPLSDASIADNGGDGSFDVYLVDFAGVGDGAFRVDQCEADNSEKCIGFMTQENDFVGYGYPSTLVANRILGSHEFFHAIQAAYDTNQGSVAAEGTAVWATEQFDPELEDFEAFLPGYMQNPDRPVDQPLPGPVDPFSYGSAIFFEFLSERFGTEAVVEMWERVENGAEGQEDPSWLGVLDAVITDHGGTGFEDAFAEFARWNLFTATFEDPEQSYADGADYPRVRIDAVDLPHSDDALRVYYASAQYFGANPDGRSEITAALVPTPEAPDSADGLRLLLVTQQTSLVTAVSAENPTAGTQTVDTSNATRFLAVVINPAASGDSQKPGLCIGTADEVATCKAAITNGGEGGNGGNGGAGGGSEGDGGAAADDGKDDDTGDEGCGCNLAERSPDGFGAAALVSFLVPLARRRSRRRR